MYQKKKKKEERKEETEWTTELFMFCSENISTVIGDAGQISCVCVCVSQFNWIRPYELDVKWVKLK